MKQSKNLLRPASLRGGLAVSLSALALAPATSLGQEPVKQLSTVRVEDTPIDANPNAQTDVPYKARTSGDARHTRPLA